MRHHRIKSALIHALESRVLLSDMTISATSGNDVISVKQTNTSTTSATLSVSNGGTASITVKVGSHSTTLAKGTSKSFTGVGRIASVDLGAGNDKFTADSSVKVAIIAAGSDGKDSITGGSGNDIISGDKATSGAYTDSIHGGGGNDTLYGYGGNDVLFGDAGNDSIRGGTGSDIIDGGSNPDKLFGESDNDSFTIVDGSVDTIDGGSGSDSSQPIQADHDIATNIENVAAAAGVDNPNGFCFTVSGTTGNDKIGASLDSNKVLLVTINGITVKYTHADRAKIVKAGGGQDSDADRIFIRGKAGNDTITAGSGIEYINGDAGNDKLSGVAKVMIGGAGNDSITAQGNFPTKIGGDFDNFTNVKEDPGSSEGFDTIIGTKYNDTIDCGGGNDNVRPGKAMLFDPQDDDEIITFSGFTAGRDTLDFSDRSDSLQIDFSSAGNDITVHGDAGDVRITDQDDNTAIIKSGTGFDIINGSNNSKGDSIDGNSGNDLINGNGGPDTLKGSSGNDTLNGNDGDDVFLNADGAKDSLFGGAGNDKGQKASSDHDSFNSVEVLT